MQETQGNASTGNREPRKTQAVVDARVAFVYTLISRKTQRAAIAAAIAKEVKKERERVTDIPKPDGSTGSLERYDAAVEAARVWGDEPPPMRTLDSYIAKAKKIYENAGAVLGTKGNFIFGVIFARNFEVYDRAIEAGNLNAAQRATEQLAELFGLNGAIKLHLTTDTTGDKAAEVPASVMTLPQIVAEMRRIRNATSLRKLVAAEPQDITREA